MPLNIIHGFPYGYPATAGIGYAIDALLGLAEGVRGDAVSRARPGHPELVVTWEQPAYSPAIALVNASQWADTVVVGAHGKSAVRGIIMGSVSVQVASQAHCPVVVVHEVPTHPAVGSPVVVGVDGSPSSTNAISYAFEQASLRGVDLQVVHAYWLESVDTAAASAIWTVDCQLLDTGAAALVAESLAGWQERYPDVHVHRHSIRGLPVEALVRESENACLVVVGTRGRGGFAGLLLGSVSHGVMHRSHGPVAVVRGVKEVPDKRRDLDPSHGHLLPVPPVLEQT